MPPESVPSRSEPRLYFSRRRMLNRLGFVPQQLWELIDPETGQTSISAYACLRHLEEMGLADEHPDGWVISCEGVHAMAANGIIYAEDAGR